MAKTLDEVIKQLPLDQQHEIEAQAQRLIEEEMTLRDRKPTFKTIVIKSHEQTMAEFAAICDAAIRGEEVTPEEPQYSFTSLEAILRKS